MPLNYLDVVVVHPIDLDHGRWIGVVPGRAAKDAEMEKFRGYRPGPAGTPVLLTPLAFETYGRWGKHAAREIRRLARARAQLPDAMASVDSTAVYRGCLIHWLRELSVALQLGNAHVLAHAVGMCAPCGAHAAPGDGDGPVALMLEQ